MKSTNWLLDFTKVSGCKINYKKTIVFLYPSNDSNNWKEKKLKTNTSYYSINKYEIFKGKSDKVDERTVH